MATRGRPPKRRPGDLGWIQDTGAIADLLLAARQRTALDRELSRLLDLSRRSPNDWRPRRGQDRMEPGAVEDIAAREANREAASFLSGEHLPTLLDRFTCGDSGKHRTALAFTDAPDWSWADVEGSRSHLLVLTGDSGIVAPAALLGCGPVVVSLAPGLKATRRRLAAFERWLDELTDELPEPFGRLGGLQRTPFRRLPTLPLDQTVTPRKVRDRLHKLLHRSGRGDFDAGQSLTVRLLAAGRNIAAGCAREYEPRLRTVFGDLLKRYADEPGIADRQKDHAAALRLPGLANEKYLKAFRSLLPPLHR